RHLVPAASRPRRRRSGGAADLAARGGAQSDHDGRLGPDRGGRAVYRLAAVLPWPDRGGADPRPGHLAPLPQGDRAGREPAPDATSPPARAPLGGRFPGGAVPLGAGMTVT